MICDGFAKRLFCYFVRRLRVRYLEILKSFFEFTPQLSPVVTAYITSAEVGGRPLAAWLPGLGIDHRPLFTPPSLGQSNSLNSKAAKYYTRKLLLYSGG